MTHILQDSIPLNQNNCQAISNCFQVWFAVPFLLLRRGASAAAIAKKSWFEHSAGGIRDSHCLARESSDFVPSSWRTCYHGEGGWSRHCKVCCVCDLCVVMCCFVLCCFRCGVVWCGVVRVFERGRERGREGRRECERERARASEPEPARAREFSLIMRKILFCTSRMFCKKMFTRVECIDSEMGLLEFWLAWSTSAAEFNFSSIVYG